MLGTFVYTIHQNGLYKECAHANTTPHHKSPIGKSVKDSLKSFFKSIDFNGFRFWNDFRGWLDDSIRNGKTPYSANERILEGIDFWTIS